MDFNNKKNVFIAGGSGYVGCALIEMLLKQNYSVHCIVREKSLNKLPKGCNPVFGNALDNNSYIKKIPSADTFVHLVGVSHPNPFKADQFRKVDLVSLQQSVDAAVASGIKHFIYLSVAHPAPLMKDYISVRIECEEILKRSELNSTILRPWYVLGPGHRWAYLLIPFYKLFEKLPSTSESAKRLGLVTLNQIVQTLFYAIKNPVGKGIRIFEVPGIRSIGMGNHSIV